MAKMASSPEPIGTHRETSSAFSPRSETAERGANDRDPVGELGSSADRGCINLLTSSRMIIEKSHSMAANSCLVQIEKWKGEPS